MSKENEASERAGDDADDTALRQEVKSASDDEAIVDVDQAMEKITQRGECFDQLRYSLLKNRAGGGQKVRLHQEGA